MAGSDNDSDDASVHSEPTIPQQQRNIQPQIITTVSNNNAKFPYLKKDEYEVWAMKMEYWITNNDMNIWKVIQNGNSLKRTGRDCDGRVIILPPTTADEHIAVQRESKARTTLLQSIPDDHVADFHYMDDARDIWNAVKARFGGNAESKKMRKSMLKQEFSEFRISKAEGLHKGYDRMQKILSQLNQLKAKPEDEDINLKFLRALPSSWSQVALTLKTKGGLEFLSFDDLYYKLKTLEVDIKGYSTFSSSQSAGPSHSASKKMSYLDSPCYSSSTYTALSNSKTGSHRSGNIIEDVLQSFVADTEPEQQLAYEDFDQIEKLDLEEMDLKWQMAMLSVRVHKFEQKAGRKIDFDKKESARFNKKKVRCYKCLQRGYFAREYRAKGGNDKQRYSSFKIQEIGKKEEDSKALITVDTLVDWTEHDGQSDGVIAPKEFGMSVWKPVMQVMLADLLSHAVVTSDGIFYTSFKLIRNSLKTWKNKKVLQKNQLTLEDKIRVLSIELENTTNLLKHSERINAIAETAKKELQTKLDNHLENPYSDAEDEGIFDSGCSRSMTGRWSGEVIIMGDFNEVRFKEERRGSMFHQYGARIFNQFITTSGLVDVRLEGFSFTWSHPSATKMSKLDRFLVSDGIISLFPSIMAICLDRHLSDHRPILLCDIQLDFGPIPFRFYHSWFSFDGFDEMVAHTWHSFTHTDRNGMIRFMKKLQDLKAHIRKWLKDKRENLSRLKHDIEADLRDIDKELDTSLISDMVLARRLDLKGQLHDIKAKESVDFIQKSKVRWAIEGDENSSFFHGIINKKRSQLAIRGVLIDGTWQTDPQDQVVDLEREVSRDEIRLPFWNCGDNKSPGPDGYTFEFFKKYWGIVGNDFCEAVEHFFVNGAFSKGCNSSFIALIPKVMDAKLVSDFRPISLIGCIYKVVTKILASRLAMVISNIVSNTQSAFVSERQILDGPFIINELLHWCKRKNKRMMFFKVDFAKAYDSVRWDYLIDVLEAFGFGMRWCQWIRGLCCFAKASVLVNGSPSREFQFQCGLKQGDPLAPLLFILVMESLHLAFSRVVEAGIFKGVGVSRLDIETAATSIGCSIMDNQFRYLGVMVGSNMSRHKAWVDVVLKLRSRLSKWKAKTLSIGGTDISQKDEKPSKKRQNRTRDGKVCENEAQSKSRADYANLGNLIYKRKKGEKENEKKKDVEGLFFQHPVLLPYFYPATLHQPLDKTFPLTPHGHNAKLAIQGHFRSKG
ncbi:RNA-directed DNA polymerase, eukaryota [Tanacetum coccineum]